MCSYESTGSESFGYCVATIITFFIHILECIVHMQTRSTLENPQNDQ